jgi:hypothetical protein
LSGLNRSGVMPAAVPAATTACARVADKAML